LEVKKYTIHVCFPCCFDDYSRLHVSVSPISTCSTHDLHEKHVGMWTCKKKRSHNTCQQPEEIIALRLEQPALQCQMCPLSTHISLSTHYIYIYMCLFHNLTSIFFGGDKKINTFCFPCRFDEIQLFRK
jgi:hypothetical protein